MTNIFCCCSMVYFLNTVFVLKVEYYKWQTFSLSLNYMLSNIHLMWPSVSWQHFIKIILPIKWSAVFLFFIFCKSLERTLLSFKSLANISNYNNQKYFQVSNWNPYHCSLVSLTLNFQGILINLILSFLLFS